MSAPVMDLADATWTPVGGSCGNMVVLYAEAMPRTAMDHVRRSNRWPRPMPMEPLFWWPDDVRPSLVGADYTVSWCGPA